MLPSRTTIPSQIPFTRTTTQNVADDVSYITLNQYLQTLGIARAKIPTNIIQDATHEVTYSAHVLWRDRNGKGKCSKRKCEDDSLKHHSGLCRMRKFRVWRIRRKLQRYLAYLYPRFARVWVDTILRSSPSSCR